MAGTAKSLLARRLFYLFDLVYSLVCARHKHPTRGLLLVRRQHVQHAGRSTTLVCAKAGNSGLVSRCRCARVFIFSILWWEGPGGFGHGFSSVFFFYFSSHGGHVIQRGWERCCILKPQGKGGRLHHATMRYSLGRVSTGPKILDTV